MRGLFAFYNQSGEILKMVDDLESYLKQAENLLEGALQAKEGGGDASCACDCLFHQNLALSLFYFNFPVG